MLPVRSAEHGPVRGAAPACPAPAQLACYVVALCAGPVTGGRGRVIVCVGRQAELAAAWAGDGVVEAGASWATATRVIFGKAARAAGNVLGRPVVGGRGVWCG